MLWKSDHKRMKIYLDTSVYNRPFDDQRQLRIQLESMAFLSYNKTD